MKVVLVINGLQKGASDAARIAQVHLQDRDIETEIINCAVDDSSTERPDLIIALGGDGTLLRAFHLFENALAPLIGINFGKLGFLSGATSTDLVKAIDYALTADAYKELRTLLEVAVHCTDRSEPLRAIALNEVMVGRGKNAKVVATALAINGHDIYSLRGDGLIVATATGSTAYALSAGGPIVSPGYDGMVVVPLASHTLVQRAIVTAPDDRVSITLPEKYRSDIVIVVDGHDLAVEAEQVGTIEICRAPAELELIKLDSRLFYDTVAQHFFSKP